MRDRRRAHGLVVVGVVLATLPALGWAAAPAVGHEGPDTAPTSATAHAAPPVPPSGVESATGSGGIPSICTGVPPTGAHGRSDPGPAAHADPPADPGPPEYYAFPLVSTGRIPGTARADGRGRVVFPASSPFGVALAEDGSYRYDLVLSTDGLPEPDAGRYVVWITTPNVDPVRRVGPLPSDGELRSRVSWNKFLVVVTLEPGDAPSATADDGDDGGADDARGEDVRSSAPEMWSGPIVLRGMSRSGMMHTMAGHGPFEQENCAAYGY